MIELKFATVRIEDWGCTTFFHDGSHFGAHHHETPHYYVLSHRLGYGDDIRRQAVEHEICHSLLEEWLFDRPSKVLWGLAHNRPLKPLQAVYEEAATQALQRWVRASERPIIGPAVDWDEIKSRALRILSPIQGHFQ